MKKTPLDLKAVRQLHQEGDFVAAKTGYLTLLKKHPKDIEILHALGILHAQAGEFAEAATYLENAINIEPENPTLYLNLANVLKSQSLFTQAAEILQKAIALKPDYVAALNNLGTVCYAQNKLDEAIMYFRLALAKQPGYLDAYYNLGLALIKQSDIPAAIETFENLVNLAPDHAAANFQLGSLLLSENRTEEALKHFLIVDENHPFHFESQSNLATSYLKLGKLNQAKQHYVNALELAPGDTQILFNLGVINMQQGHTDSAIQNYQRVLKIKPNDFATHNNIAVAFLAKNHPAYALEHFRKALALQPDNKAIQYTVNVLSQDQRLLASPPDYIKNLFDAYADHYELHLLEGLDYKIPELLLQAVMPHLIKQTDLAILDLGCGTGLCGVPFKPLAATLTGVDLSPNMLAIAEQKNIYTELVCEEFAAFLKTKNQAYDVIIAGDAFVYVGDLAEIFVNLAHALKANGIVVFNTEISASSDYNMNQSGRFSHQKNYLAALAEQNGLAIVSYQQIVTRQQNNEPVYGHLYVMQKPARE